MSVFDDWPILDLDKLRPQRFRVITSGGGFDGGQNGRQSAQTIDLTGGGLFKVSLGPCVLEDPDQQAYAQGVDALLSTGGRYVNVPIIADYAAPLRRNMRGRPQPYRRLFFDPDGSLRESGTFGDPSVTATAQASAALNAGQINITLAGQYTELQPTIFSIQHSEKGHRAYRIWEISGRGQPTP